MKKAGFIIGCILLSVLLAGVFYMGGRTLVAFMMDKEDEPQPTITGDEEHIDPLPEDTMLEIQDGERTNVLLLGIDARDADGSAETRTDTMILVSVDPELKKALIISIPRDTRVTINGTPNQKICTANVYGGPKLAMKKVEELLHTHVDYYAKANFEGFAQIIDILGGITLDVEQRMYKPSEDIDLQPGVQTLDGADALSYVRFRDYIMGDIDRTSHQQKFLQALVEKVTQPATLLKIPKILDAIKENLETDMTMKDIIRIASWAPLFDKSSVVTQTVPGYFLDIRDSAGTLLNSFWEADKAIAPYLIDNLYQGKYYDTVTSEGVMEVHDAEGEVTEEGAEGSEADNEETVGLEDPFSSGITEPVVPSEATVGTAPSGNEGDGTGTMPPSTTAPVEDVPGELPPPPVSEEDLGELFTPEENPFGMEVTAPEESGGSADSGNTGGGIAGVDVPFSPEVEDTITEIPAGEYGDEVESNLVMGVDIPYPTENDTVVLPDPEVNPLPPAEVVPPVVDETPVP